MSASRSQLAKRTSTGTGRAQAGPYGGGVIGIPCFAPDLHQKAILVFVFNEFVVAVRVGRLTWGICMGTSGE